MQANQNKFSRDRIAEVYFGQWDDPETQARARRRIHWLAANVIGERVLDIGCSQGVLGVLLARENFKYVGIDVNKDAIEYAQRLAAETLGPLVRNVTFLAMNIYEAEDLGGEFDTLVLGEILEHVTQPARLLAHALRFLRPGGRLLLTTPFGYFPDPDHRQTFTLSDVVSLVKPHCEISVLEVQDGYIRLVGHKIDSTNRQDNDDKWNAAVLLQLTERAAIDSQVTLRNALTNVQSALTALRRESEVARQQTQELEKRLRHELEKQIAAEVEQRYQQRERELREEIEALKRAAAEAEARYQQREQDLSRRLEHASKLYSLAQRQLAELESRYEATARELEKVKNSTSFRLGHALVLAVRKPGVNTLALPVRLFRLLSERKRTKRASRASSRGTNHTSQEANQARHQTGSSSHRNNSDDKPYLLWSVVPEPIIDPSRLPNNLSELRVACIMDDFTYECYSRECHLFPLTPDNWQAEMEAAQPHFLFVESAWAGKDGLWRRKISGTSKELVELIQWCRARQIPTVFWNKEDPVHFDTFIRTASLFDFVFTTDIDCVARYKAVLGHDRVGVLPFACQPALHNPIQTMERKDAFCFAGSYYARYPERQRDMETFVDTLSKLRPFVIYDRNLHSSSTSFMFPEKYRPFIVGHLRPDEIDKAYKGYKYGINMNSVKYSQSMFARRVYELLASNSIVVSNFSRGLRNLFGDLVIATDDPGELQRRLQPILDDDVYYRKIRLLGLRKVMSEHTYSDRLALIVRRVFGRELGFQWPRVTMIAFVRNQHDYESVSGAFARQNYPNKRLVLICGEGYKPDTPGQGVVLYSEQEARQLHFRDVVQDGFVSLLVPTDWYGPNYLIDLVLAVRYSDAKVIGKGAYFCNVSGQVQLRNTNLQYQWIDAVPVRRAVAAVDVLGDEPLYDWASNVGNRQFSGTRILSVDEFNYCEDGVDLREPLLGDLDIDPGIPLERLLALADRAVPTEEVRALEWSDLVPIFGLGEKDGVSLEESASGLSINSHLEPGRHVYRYACREFSLAEFGFDDKAIFHLDMTLTLGLDVRLAVILLDEAGKRLETAFALPNRTLRIELPDRVARIRLALRVAGTGRAYIRRILLAELAASSVHLPRSNVLLVTKQYPHYSDLYRYGFVHRRVLLYRCSGLPVDVMRFSRNAVGPSYYEFQNVDVRVGYKKELDTALRTGQYHTVLVHVLDEDMWEVLSNYLDKVRVIVWLHGAEVQPWYRRSFDHRSEEEKQQAIKKSERRMRFWRKVFSTDTDNLHFVFVSRHFASEVMSDVGITLPENRYSIIHNFIDTELFAYQEKPIEQRKKILSIRPFVSAKYANDQTVAAILELTREPFFSDLEFRIVGDGPLFDETVAPLRKYPNVILEKRFLRQEEIATLQKEYGIFLCPTRWDSQGVSRDEAMSSGLVPITTRVAAVPEFVDEECGILADPEDFRGLAEGIRRLYHDPGLFRRLSRAAAERVRRQSGFSQTILAELDLIRNSQR